MEFLKTSIFLRLWVKSYQRNCQKGFLRVQGNVSSGNIFLQKLYFLMFSRNKATFLGTTDNKPWEGSQKCSLEVQRTILGKKQKFWKKNFEKKFRTSSGKLSANLRTAFVVCNGTCSGKSGSPQRGILFVPTLDSEQKTLGRFVKPLLEASRATFLRKKCFLDETLFILVWDLEWKTNDRVVKLASYMTTKKNEVKHVFLKKPHSHVFSTFFEWMTFDRVENRNLLVQKNVLGLFSWQKLFLSPFSKFEQKTCQRFGETFSAWLSELKSRCPEEHFDAQHFFGKVRLLLSIRDFER